MNVLPSTTVEIFHDAECGRQDIDGVLTGVEIINAITGSLVVVRSDRQMRISAPGAPHVEPEKVRWGNLPADLTVVVTDRKLKISSDLRNDKLHEGMYTGVTGAEVKLSEYSPGFATRENGKRVAVVSPGYSLSKGGLAAHEIGHLLNLKTSGTKLDPDSYGHCIDDACLMAAVEPLTRRRLAREMLLISPAEVDKAIKRLNLPALPEGPPECFCDECGAQLAELAVAQQLGHNN